MMPKVVVFDLDGTLAESKQALTSEMAAKVNELLTLTKVAVISGGALPQFLKQVVDQLPRDANLANLFLLPTSGGAFYEYQTGSWHKIYEEHLTPAEASEIEAAMRAAAKETGLIDFSTTAYGERIENRGAQIALSALGQQAPVALKKEWDPDHTKRRALQQTIAAKLPGFSVGMGGLTTIDVTKRGIDKAYGIHQLAARLHIDEKEMLYVGDELVAGGNDEAVFQTNAQVRAVASPEETGRVIVSLLPI